MLIAGLSVIDRQGSIALYETESEGSPALLGDIFLDEKQSLSLTVADGFVSLLNKHHKTIEDISLVGFSHGPGSFTGLRIGLSALKGLLFESDIPVVGLSSLACYGFSYPLSEGEVIAPLFDARKGEVYFGLYRFCEGSLVSLTDDKACSPAWCKAYLAKHAPDAYIVGGGRGKYAETFRSFPSLDKAFRSSASSAVELAWQSYKEHDGKFSAVHPLHLHYCRASEAERSLGEVIFTTK